MTVLRRLAAFLSISGLALLVALALLVSAMRLAPPLADDYRDTLADTLSQRLGYRVSIGTLNLGLSGWTPRLTLGQVTLSDPKTESASLGLKAIRLDLDALSSLRTASPQISALTLEGAHLEVRRLRDGRLRLVGLDALQGAHPQTLERFLEQGRVNLIETDILFVDEGLGRKLAHVTGIRLALHNEGARHRLELSARLLPLGADSDMPAPDNQLYLNADLEGPASDPGAWHGRVDVRLDGTDPGGLLPLDQLGLRTLDSGSFRLESWNHIRAGRLEASLLRFALAGLTLAPAPSAGRQTAPAAIGMGPLHGLARLRPLEAGWQIQIADLQTDVRDADESVLELDLLIAEAGRRMSMRFDAERLSLDLNPLFSERLRLERVGGRLDWGRETGGGWRLAAEDIELETADVTGQTRFTLTQAADGASPVLDLRARFRHEDLVHLRPYLPAGIMHPDLVEWLTRSIKAGRVPQAEVVFRGPLEHHPFRRHEGRFELFLPFEDMLLDYRSGWPPIIAAAGHLRFLNQGLTIRVERGRIYDSAFSAGKVDIPELRGLRRMRIHGEAEGPFADGLRTLADTPLAEKLGRFAKTLTVEGTSRLALDIDLPLAQGEPPLQLAGQLSWPAQASLGIQGTPLLLTGLKGRLDLTDHSLSAQSIAAQLWGHPLQLDLTTEGAGDSARSLTRIEAHTKTPVIELARRLPSPLWSNLSGDLDWNLAVRLHHRDLDREAPALDYRLSSTLRGLSIDLPSPLGKATGVARNLDLAGTLRPGQTLDSRGRLGDLALSLNLGLGGTTPRVSGRLRLGDDSVPAPERPGLFLDGTLTELDLPVWLTWATTARAESSSLVATGSSPAPDWLAGAQLRVERLRWGQTRLGALDLDLDQDAAGMHLSNLTLSGTGLLSASGEGDWIRAPDGGRSRLNLTLGSADLGALARALDEQSVLEAGQSVATVRLNWPGGLGDFAWPDADGVIDLKVNGGRLPEVEPGIGRVLGFLNLSALNRRLMLDFSDLYGQGFAFEQIAGRIAVGAGQAQFEDFVIAGPAGKLIVGGSSDLATRDLDQTVTVEPKLGSSVALASAVVGGPLLGAAVYLVDRVAGNPIDQLGRYRYRVTGPWSEPEIRRLGWEPWMNGAAAIESIPRAMSSGGRSLFLDPE